MPSDSLKLECLYCGHKQTIRVGRGLWWTCKGKPGKPCGKRNPGPTIVGDIVRSALAAKEIVIGKRPKRRPPEDAAGAPAPSPPRSPAPSSAGTTVGRRRAAGVAQTSKEQPVSNRKVDGGAAASRATVGGPRKQAAATNGSSAGATTKTETPSFGRRLLHVAKEALI